MTEELQKSRLAKPEFHSESGRFRLVFYKHPLADERLKEMGLTDRQLSAVVYVKEHGSISNAEYQELAGISKRTATRELNELTLKDVLSSEGGSRGRGKRYFLSIS